MIGSQCQWHKTICWNWAKIDRIWLQANFFNETLNLTQRLTIKFSQFFATFFVSLTLTSYQWIRIQTLSSLYFSKVESGNIYIVKIYFWACTYIFVHIWPSNHSTLLSKLKTKQFRAWVLGPGWKISQILKNSSKIDPNCLFPEISLHKDHLDALCVVRCSELKIFTTKCNKDYLFKGYVYCFVMVLWDWY